MSHGRMDLDSRAGQTPVKEPAGPDVVRIMTRPGALALAPMEGISDAVVRDLLSDLGGMDLCVTEFIRVSHRPVTEKVLLRECPELTRGGTTPSGVPVMVQLLGGDPALVAESALRAQELGALGVDLNFGCPARKVNGHDGGAALLRSPERLESIISACRSRLRIPVSAKIRLGWEDDSGLLDLARAVERGGACWLTIHGRTKVQMYRGQADWEAIGRARAAVSIPVIANGDLFRPRDVLDCARVTGCTSFMLGRGAFRTPNLFRWTKGLDDRAWSFDACATLLQRFIARVFADPRFDRPERAALNRLKGWVRALGDRDPDFDAVFHRLKRAQTSEEAVAWLTNTPTETILEAHA